MTKLISLIVWFVLSTMGNSEEIHIRHDRLEAHVSADDKIPYDVAGIKVKDAKSAASLLRYIYANWSKGNRPMLVVASHSKRALAGEDVFWKAVTEVATRWKVRVIHMPDPVSRAPNSDLEVSRLIKGRKKVKAKK